MPKKFIIFAILVAVIFGGTVGYLWMVNKDRIQQFFASTNSSIEELVGGGVKTEEGDLQSDSLVRSLNDQMLAVAVINPRHIDPLIAHLAKLRTRFAQTKLWVKFNVDQIIDQAFSAQAATAPVPGMPTNMTELMEFLRREWGGIKEFSVAVSKSTFTLAIPDGKEIAVPKILLSLQFTDQAARTRVSNLIAEQFPSGENTLSIDGVTIERSGENPDHYEVSMIAPTGSPVSAAIDFTGTQALISLGTKQQADFLSTGAAGGGLLVDSAGWQQARMSMLSHPGGFFMADVKSISGFIRSLESVMTADGSSDPVFEQIFSSEWLNSHGIFSSSFAVNNGVAVRVCSQLAKDSSLAGIYAPMLEQAALDVGVEKISPRIVGDRTVLGVDITGRFVKAYIDSLASFAKIYPLDELQKNPTKYPPELIHMIENYLALSKLLKGNPIKNISLVLNAPSEEEMGLIMQAAMMGGSPPVDFSVLLEFRNSMSPTALAKLLNNLAILFLTSSGLPELPSASVVPATAGLQGEMVQVGVGQKPVLVGTSLSENTILFGKDSAMVMKTKDQLQKPASLLNDEKTALRGLPDMVKRSDVVGYLSTTPLLVLAKSFAPQVLGFAPPEMQITLPEVEEVLEALKTQVLVAQRGTKVSDELYCFENRGIAL